VIRLARSAMKAGSSAGRKVVPCTATISEPHSSATSQASMGRSASLTGLILVSGSFTPPLWPPFTVGEGA
jgi:hypothetical protein